MKQNPMYYYPKPRYRGTGVFFAFDYLIGLAVFGFAYWVLNGILPGLQIISVHDVVYKLAMFFWGGSIVIYLVFGPFYFWNRLKEYDKL